MSGLILNARGANGDSGGPVFNSQNELIGITDSGSTSISSTGNTNYVYLGEPSTNAWVKANASIPEPSTLALLLTTVVAAASRRRRHKDEGRTDRGRGTG